MFAGGLMSRNVGMRRVSSERRPMTTDHDGNEGIWNPLQLADNFKRYKNWPSIESDDAPKKKRKRMNPIDNRFYAVKINASVNWVSFGGGLFLTSVITCVIGAYLAYHGGRGKVGPATIGLGLFILIVSLTILFEERDDNNRILHIRDIYSQVLMNYEKEKNRTDATCSLSNELQNSKLEKSRTRIICKYERKRKRRFLPFLLLSRHYIVMHETDNHEENS